MNGANLQFFVHDIMPHVFPMLDLEDVPSYTESWKEITSFIQNVSEDNPLIVKADQVHWNGTRKPIADEDYITLSRDQVPN